VDKLKQGKGGWTKNEPNQNQLQQGNQVGHHIGQRLLIKTEGAGIMSEKGVHDFEGEDRQLNLNKVTRKKEGTGM